MKELTYKTSLFICSRCGSYGRYQVYMTYTYLSLFFIPVFKWNRRYYAKTSCCGTVYELPQEIGRRIARGEELSIAQDTLTMITAGSGGAKWSPAKRCSGCGYETTEDFEYCPKCGRRF